MLSKIGTLFDFNFTQVAIKLSWTISKLPRDWSVTTFSFSQFLSDKMPQELSFYHIISQVGHWRHHSCTLPGRSLTILPLTYTTWSVAGVARRRRCNSCTLFAFFAGGITHVPRQVVGQWRHHPCTLPGRLLAVSLTCFTSSGRSMMRALDAQTEWKPR